MSKEMRKIKDVPYEIKGDKVVLHLATGPVELPLELGKSAYSVAWSFLNRKEGARSRGVNGTHALGNFTYSVNEEEKTLTVTRKSGEVVVTKGTDQELKYPRTFAIKVILGFLE
jgi:hypothetical protein